MNNAVAQQAAQSAKGVEPWRARAFDPATPTGLIDMDLSEMLQTPFPATTPLTLSRYMVIRAGESLAPKLHASAQTLCVLRGKGISRIGEEQTQWHAGDVLLLPCTGDIEHRASCDSVICMIVQDGALHYYARTIGFSFIWRQRGRANASKRTTRNR